MRQRQVPNVSMGSVRLLVVVVLVGLVTACSTVTDAEDADSCGELVDVAVQAVEEA